MTFIKRILYGSTAILAVGVLLFVFTKSTSTASAMDKVEGHIVASARGSASAAFVNYSNFMGLDGVSSVRSQVTTLNPDLLRQLSVIKYV